ncbi:MAG TPA: 3-oxoacid CoA-transferase subunit B [Dehalococcoidia bacterium]|nr:3-oxoacid CoA-transferase subunit B [Dehalococcoidia bacterium]
MTGLSRDLICLRASKELKPGMYVNLGIGLPTQVANFTPEGVILHSQNGVLGFGPIASEDEMDWELVNAGAQPITLQPGISFFHSADAFVMMRGRHLDVAILGAYQVSATGDLANWRTEREALGAIGGSMDLAYGAKRIIVICEHTDRDGKPRIVKQCTLPLTAKGVVNTIITNLCLIEVTSAGLELIEIAPGISIDYIQRFTEPKVILSRDLKEMEF